MSTSSLPSASQLQKRVSACLGAALEAWAHTLLYQRRVYPSATFTCSSFLGVRSYVSRHPGVVAYIHETIQVAVPSLVSGVAQDITLTIVDENAAAGDGQSSEDDTITRISELESYIMRFRVHSIENDARGVTTTEAIDRIERGLRNILLSALAVEHGRPTTTTISKSEDGASFRLSLHIAEKDRTCAELNEAFSTGSWYVSSETDDNTARKSKGRVIRPLHQFEEASFGTIQFAMMKPKHATEEPSAIS